MEYYPEESKVFKNVAILNLPDNVSQEIMEYVESPPIHASEKEKILDEYSNHLSRLIDCLPLEQRKDEFFKLFDRVMSDPITKRVLMDSYYNGSYCSFGESLISLKDQVQSHADDEYGDDDNNPLKYSLIEPTIIEIQDYIEIEREYVCNDCDYISDGIRCDYCGNKIDF
jgi:hypothetical protein